MTYSPTNICSTIGAVGLNFSVRDGKRWIPNAINRLNKGPIIVIQTLVSNILYICKPFCLSLKSKASCGCIAQC